MKKVLGAIMALAGFIATTAHGDALLTYELTQQGKEASVQKVAIDRFFARVDDSAKPETYLLFQAGKYFPLYEVNPSEKSYRQLTREINPIPHAGSSSATAEVPAKSPPISEAANAAEAPPSPTEQTTDVQGDPVEAEATAESANEKPAIPTAQAKTKPELRATKDKRQVAGIECRVVEEIEDGKAVMQHCMANKARLGITERETRTLARLFAMARDRGYGWLGAGTADEDFVSIQTRNLADSGELNLDSVSTDPLPADRLQIPTGFKQAK